MANSEHKYEDLSNHHKPLTSLFPYIENLSESALTQLRLSDEQLKFYEENGYLTNILLLTNEQVEVLLNEFQKDLLDPKPEARKLFHEIHANECTDPNLILYHSLGAWRITKGFHDLLWHASLLVKASQLLGGPVRLWHDQLFVKPAKHGACVAWHQDYSYWTRTKPQAHLTIHIALDEQTVENGCLHYIPKSHKWPLLPITSRHFDNMESILEVLNQDQKDQFKPVPMLLKKGEMSFHHPYTVHGSYGNKSNGSRRATVVNLIKDGVVSDTDDNLLDGIPVISKGLPLNGQFFPLLLNKTVV